jgi:hypothetical protein
MQTSCCLLTVFLLGPQQHGYPQVRLMAGIY